LSETKVEISRTIDLAGDLSAEICIWLVDNFITEDDSTVWSSVDWHILVWVGDNLVSHAEIVERTVSVGSKKIPVGGIGGVITKAEWKNQGFASTSMKVAQKYICGELNLDFGLLMCDKKVVSFYKKLGWEVVQGPLVYKQPTGKVEFDDIVMVYHCGSVKWPDGLIDAQGPPW